MHCWLPNAVTTQICMVWSCIPRSGCHATLGASYPPDQAVYFGPKSRMYSTLLITKPSSSTPVIIRTCGKFSVRDPQSLGESQGPNINSQDIWQLGLLLSDRWWVATRKFKVNTASTLFAKLVRNYLAPECVRPQGLVRVALERDVVPGRVDGHVPIALADGAVAAHQRVRLQRRGDLERQADGAAVAVGLVGGKHSSGRRDGEAHDCIGGSGRFGQTMLCSGLEGRSYTTNTAMPSDLRGGDANHGTGGRGPAEQANKCRVQRSKVSETPHAARPLNRKDLFAYQR